VSKPPADHHNVYAIGIGCDDRLRKVRVERGPYSPKERGELVQLIRRSGGKQGIRPQFLSPDDVRCPLVDRLGIDVSVTSEADGHESIRSAKDDVLVELWFPHISTTRRQSVAHLVCGVVDYSGEVERHERTVLGTSDRSAGDAPAVPFVGIGLGGNAGWLQ
jgi:hypothetical protein